MSLEARKQFRRDMRKLMADVPSDRSDIAKELQAIYTMYEVLDKLGLINLQVCTAPTKSPTKSK